MSTKHVTLTLTKAEFEALRWGVSVLSMLTRRKDRRKTVPLATISGRARAYGSISRKLHKIWKDSRIEN